MSAPATLQLDGARKVFFPGTVNEVAALERIDLEVPAGRFVSIIGSNGSGKSTLLNSIAGTFRLTAGPVLWAARTSPDRRNTSAAAPSAGCSRTRAPARRRR